MNNQLGSTEETKITPKFITCMLNSFQSLMSIFMIRTVYEMDVIDDHTKLFVSSAHYLHKIHGKLDTNDSTGDGQGSNLKK